MPVNEVRNIDELFTSLSKARDILFRRNNWSEQLEHEEAKNLKCFLSQDLSDRKRNRRGMIFCSVQSELYGLIRTNGSNASFLHLQRKYHREAKASLLRRSMTHVRQNSARVRD